MPKFTLSATRAGYAKHWATIQIKGGKDAANAAYFAKKIMASEAVYKQVEALTGVPWYFIGALHMRESGCDFAGVLHNGDKIIGSGRLTYRVPAGRGPFKTWTEAAVDALKLKNLQNYRGKWCPSLMGFVSEGFNGIGYFNKGIRSPYVYAGTNYEQTGKYIRDHVFDPNFDDPQLGTFCVLKQLCNIDFAIKAAMVEPEPIISPTTAKVALGVGGATATGGAAYVATPDASTVTDIATDTATSSIDTLQQIMPFVQFLSEYGVWVGVAVGVTLAVGVVAYKFYQRRDD